MNLLRQTFLYNTKENIMLHIKDLHANIDGKEILKGINLEIKPGEVHAIMGQTVLEKAPWLR